MVRGLKSYTTGGEVQGFNPGVKMALDTGLLWVMWSWGDGGNLVDMNEVNTRFKSNCISILVGQCTCV